MLCCTVIQRYTWSNCTKYSKPRAPLSRKNLRVIFRALLLLFILFLGNHVSKSKLPARVNIFIFRISRTRQNKKLSYNFMQIAKLYFMYKRTPLWYLTISQHCNYKLLPIPTLSLYLLLYENLFLRRVQYLCAISVLKKWHFLPTTQ